MEEVTSNTTIAVIMAYLDCYDMEYWWRNISSYQGFLPYRVFFCTGNVRARAIGAAEGADFTPPDGAKYK